MSTTEKTKIAILGASGYTGAELVRMLARHPAADITVLTADRKAGQTMAQVFPHLGGLKLPDLVSIEDAKLDDVDLVFCALPHGTTQDVIAALPKRLKIVDLSADFRLADVDVYARWYGHAHKAPALQETAVYGLTELYRKQVKKARLVANPGCYPTSAQLPLVPLIEDGLIETKAIVIDSKSGASGAGRTAKENILFCEMGEGFSAYGVANHRHAPEIEQGLSRAAGGKPIVVAFTPHLLPISRGILSTIYVELHKDTTADDLRSVLERRYKGEPFVRVLPKGQAPSTAHVRGANTCLMGVFADRVPGRAIIVSAIDNLVKGASGQAIQNMNVMLDLPETMGLEQEALFP